MDAGMGHPRRRPYPFAEGHSRSFRTLAGSVRRARRPAWASWARNAALSRATGDLVQVLDHDDLLLSGATALLIRRFEENSILWAVGAADDLLGDGTRKPWNSALPFGLIPAGTGLAHHEQRRKARGGSLLADLQNAIGSSPITDVFEAVRSESPVSSGGDDEVDSDEVEGEGGEE